MIISLFGIILIQVLWIRNAIKTEEAQFDKNVYNALTSGISRLEKENMFLFMDRNIELPPPPPKKFDSLVEIYIPEPPEIDVLVTDSGVVKLRSGSSVIILNDSVKTKHIITLNNR